MPQSHRTPGPRMGCSQAVLNRNRMSNHRVCAAPYKIFLLVRGLWSFNACIMEVYGPRTGLEIINSPCRIFSNYGCVNSLTCPLGRRMASLWVTYGLRGIWKTLKIPVRGPYDACMGIAWGTRGVLRIIQPKHTLGYRIRAVDQIRAVVGKKDNILIRAVVSNKRVSWKSWSLPVQLHCIGRHKPDAGNKAFVLNTRVEPWTRKSTKEGPNCQAAEAACHTVSCQTAQNRIGRNIKYRKFRKF